MAPSMSPAAELNVIGFLAYERLGGPEGLDRIAEEAAYVGEFIPDEDGDQAYAEMLERRAQDWADRENCPDWAR
jgi:hypothetical protein